MITITIGIREDNRDHDRGRYHQATEGVQSILEGYGAKGYCLGGKIRKNGQLVTQRLVCRSEEFFGAYTC